MDRQQSPPRLGVGSTARGRTTCKGSGMVACALYKARAKARLLRGQRPFILLAGSMSIDQIGRSPSVVVVLAVMH